jgi:hypothetical protein
MITLDLSLENLYRQYYRCALASHLIKKAGLTLTTGQTGAVTLTRWRTAGPISVGCRRRRRWNSRRS